MAANRLHHETPDAALFTWLRASSATIRELGVQLHTVGRTHDAIVREGMLQGYSGLIRYPYGREGGLMKLVARVTEGRDGQAPFDGAIYLIDPVDPSSIFPRRWRSSGSASPTVARSFRRWPAPSNGWRSNACTRA